MGACLPKNTNKKLEEIDDQDTGPPKPPLKQLKQQLQGKLNLDKEHHFNVFVQYKFWKSYRRDLKKFEKRKKAHEKTESETMNAESKAGLPVTTSESQAKKKASEVPQEDNMLLVSWFEDPVNLSKEGDVSAIDSLTNA